MKNQLNPYITFADTCRDAMELYRSVLGGELQIMTFGESGGLDGEGADKVMHAQLETPEGYTIMAADAAPGMPAPQGSQVSLSISGEDGDTLRGYWDKLAEGATVQMPLAPQVWGDTFGMLVDRFGIPWMINIAGPMHGAES